MKIRQVLLLILFIGMLIFPVCAARPVDGTMYSGINQNYTVTNASLNVYTILPLTLHEAAYPIELFYLLFVLAIMFLVYVITCLASSDGVPVRSMVLASALSWTLFLICAFLAPLTADIYVVASSIQITNVAVYVFSPPIMYICYGLWLIMFVLMWYGVLLWYRMLALNQKRISDPNRQFEDLI